MGSHIGVISAEHERGAKQRAAIEEQIEKSTRSPKIRSVSEAQRYIIILLFNESTIKLELSKCSGSPSEQREGKVSEQQSMSEAQSKEQENNSGV